METIESAKSQLIAFCFKSPHALKEKKHLEPRSRNSFHFKQQIVSIATWYSFNFCEPSILCSYQLVYYPDFNIVNKMTLISPQSFTRNIGVFNSLHDDDYLPVLKSQEAMVTTTQDSFTWADISPKVKHFVIAAKMSLLNDNLQLPMWVYRG